MTAAASAVRAKARGSCSSNFVGVDNLSLQIELPGRRHSRCRGTGGTAARPHKTVAGPRKDHYLVVVVYFLPSVNIIKAYRVFFFVRILILRALTVRSM